MYRSVIFVATTLLCACSSHSDLRSGAGATAAAGGVGAAALYAAVSALPAGELSAAAQTVGELSFTELHNLNTNIASSSLLAGPKAFSQTYDGPAIVGLRAAADRDFGTLGQLLHQLNADPNAVTYSLLERQLAAIGSGTGATTLADFRDRINVAAYLNTFVVYSAYTRSVGAAAGTPSRDLSLVSTIACAGPNLPAKRNSYVPQTQPGKNVAAWVKARKVKPFDSSVLEGGGGVNGGNASAETLFQYGTGWSQTFGRDRGGPVDTIRTYQSGYLNPRDPSEGRFGCHPFEHYIEPLLTASGIDAAADLEQWGPAIADASVDFKYLEQARDRIRNPPKPPTELPGDSK